MLVQMDGEASFLDYREKAALAAHRDMYLDERGEVIPNSTLIGAQAIAVPGTVAVCGKHISATANCPGKRWSCRRRNWLKTVSCPPKFS